MSTVYDETRRRHIEHLLPQLAEHFERVGWSAERLHEERTARLRDLVSVAVERSDWHRARLGDVNLATLDEDTLRELPRDDEAGPDGQLRRDRHRPRIRLRSDVNAHIASLTPTHTFEVSSTPSPPAARPAFAACSYGAGTRGRPSS